MIKVGVVGGTGYTGVELLRLLVRHPEVKLQAITSRSDAGTRVDELYPSLRGHTDSAFCMPDLETLVQCDVVFFATPNGVAMKSTPALLQAGVKVIDISADFRLQDIDSWQHWYGMQHECPELVAEAVYGLPELNRAEIAKARLIACAGCYPTSVQLGWMPLIKAGLVDTSRLIANGASGISGAGRQAKIDNLLAEAGDSFKAYGVAGHRHLPEIEQGLAHMSGAPVNLTFVPHLLPMIRGINATLYANVTADNLPDLQALYEETYADEPFVDVLPAGSHPQTRSVRGSNMCRIAVHRPQDRDTIVVLSAIDNLTKGASGQALQNMNLMMGLPETMGLEGVALSP